MRTQDSSDNNESIRKRLKPARAILKIIPKGREGKPEEIGDVAVFLASGASEYVTGATVIVDGGWLAGCMHANQKKKKDMLTILEHPLKQELRTRS